MSGAALPSCRLQATVHGWGSGIERLCLLSGQAIREIGSRGENHADPHREVAGCSGYEVRTGRREFAARRSRVAQPATLRLHHSWRLPRTFVPCLTVPCLRRARGWYVNPIAVSTTATPSTRFWMKGSFVISALL